MRVVKMNPEVKAKWLMALRSGEFTQGKGALRVMKDSIRSPSGESHCCLGVLCELYKRDHPDDPKADWQGKGFYGRTAYPAPIVLEWAGFIEADPKVNFQIRGVDMNGIGVLNDNIQDGFKTVADRIERDL
jgi:hypothetical protein